MHGLPLHSLTKNANPKPKHNTTQVLITASPGTTLTLPSTFAAQFCDSPRTACALVHTHTRPQTHPKRTEQLNPSSWGLSHPKCTGQQQGREIPRYSQLGESCTASQPPLQTLPGTSGCSNSLRPPLGQDPAPNSSVDLCRTSVDLCSTSVDLCRTSPAPCPASCRADISSSASPCLPRCIYTERSAPLPPALC